MKNVLLPILGAVVFIVLVGLFTQKAQEGTFKVSSNNKLEKSEVKIGETTIPVEVAQTEMQRKKGLSDRKSLPKNEGMFFVFAQKNVQPPFWMKDMNFAIDIIWIDDEKIVQIHKNVQPPAKDTPNSELTLYAPNQPIDYVLEVNAGFTEENNIKVGDTIDLPNL